MMKDEMLILRELVLVEGGDFNMGSKEFEGEEDERPIHIVKVNDFYMSKFLVTQRLWKEIMSNNPSTFKYTNNPVEHVSWIEAVRFCNELSEIDGLETCYKEKNGNMICDFMKNGYRLPTEAEWEYSARGGIFSEGHVYSGSNDLSDSGWFDENSKGKTHAVGRKKPNELGIYDMSGNVFEWCNDWKDKHGYYSITPYNYDNPKGPVNGEEKVMRGGSYFWGDWDCRVNSRFSHSPFSNYEDVGLRIVIKA